MTTPSSRYVDEWRAYARRDWRGVGLMLDGGEAFLAGEHLQQSVEKFLKGFLIGRGWSLQRTHDLPALLNAALAFEPSLEQFRDLTRRLTEYYLVQRYPGSKDSDLSVDDVREDARQGAALVARLFPDEILEAP